jgi:hypothetical protein
MLDASKLFTAASAGHGDMRRPAPRSGPTIGAPALIFQPFGANFSDFMKMK